MFILRLNLSPAYFFVAVSWRLLQAVCIHQWCNAYHQFQLLVLVLLVFWFGLYHPFQSLLISVRILTDFCNYLFSSNSMYFLTDLSSLNASSLTASGLSIKSNTRRFNMSAFSIRLISCSGVYSFP